MAPGVAIEEMCRKAGEDRNVKARFVPVLNEALRPEDVVVIGDKASTNS